MRTITFILSDLVMLITLVLLVGIIVGTQVRHHLVRLYHHCFQPITLRTTPNAVRHVLRMEDMRDRAQHLSHDLYHTGVHGCDIDAHALACRIQDEHIDTPRELTPRQRQEVGLDNYTGPSE